MSEAPPPLGTLTDRVQVQRKDMSVQSEGGLSITYVPLATVWARVRVLSARQDQVRDGRGVTASHVVVLRFRNDLTPGDRLVYRGRNLELLSAADINGRRAYLSCVCTENAVTG